jgi:hypothetical protein
VLQFEGGMATLTIQRAILDDGHFEAELRDILSQAIKMQAELK